VPNIIETFSLTKKFSALNDYRALLRFRRQETLTAVNSVSLQIQAGELFGLLGANGAGKTTFIKLLSTLILPTAGRAVIGGYDVVAQAPAVKAMIGWVDTQERSLFWRLTGRQNLAFFAALYGLPRAQVNARITEVLALVELTEQAGRRVMTYSSGMRQRLAVARALLARPQIIFMDEPTRSLDPINARALRRFIRQTLVDRLGCTVVLVTHHLDEAATLCDRLAIMHRGRIIACGSVAEIGQRVTAPYYQPLALSLEELFIQLVEGNELSGPGLHPA